MSFNIGSTNFGQIYVGSTRIGEVYVGSVKVYPDSAPNPRNPLGLPSNTIRWLFEPGDDPHYGSGGHGTWSKGGTWTQVSQSPNVWDYTFSGTDWTGRFNRPYANTADSEFYATKCLGGNLDQVTNCKYLFYFAATDFKDSVLNMPNVTNVQQMFSETSVYNPYDAPMMYLDSLVSAYNMFFDAYGLQHIPVFYAPNLTSLAYFCENATDLVEVPQLDITNVISMDGAFQNAGKVESGSYNLYVTASTKSIPVQSYNNCFNNCGLGTTSGQAELAKIPSSWGGRKYV